jgi:NAD(P) transhydrogenase subunit alpha
VKIAVVSEQASDERRVAATPETARKFIALGAEVAVEIGAGAGAAIADSDYAAAGASLGPRAATLAGAEIVLAVQPPAVDSLDGLAPGAA